MAVLVLNAGSSTLKATLLELPDRNPVFRDTVSWGADATAAGDRGSDLGGVVERANRHGAPLIAVGHRIVHGGSEFRSPVVVDDDALRRLQAVAELAPLHNPVALEALRAVLALLPGVPHVACFDTAFHATLDEAAWRYPVPRDWDAWGIRRYGFHGLSVEWAVARTAELLERSAANLRLVIAHLGSGASVTAVDAGRSVWTSMGYTPLEGLMMGTRAGSIDPGILLALLRDGHRDAETLSDELDHRSGLVAVGASADMRELEASAATNPAAALAIEMFVRRTAAGMAAAMTAVPTVDALVFTGGIGENAARVRSAIIARLASVGVPEAGSRDDDGALSAPGRTPVVLRVEAREDVVIAEAALAAAQAG